MKRSILPLFASSLLLLIAAGTSDDFKRETPRTDKDPLEGKPPPALSVTHWLNAPDGGIKLADLKGKVVLLDFWGTWCGPCVASMPHMKELYNKHKDQGLVIIGIHTTSGGEKMADFVKKESLPWAIALDVDEKTVKAFAVDSYPDYYLIDRAGKLQVADIVNSEVDRAVDVLLKEPVPK